MNIHHVGYLVKNVEKASDKFKLLGFSAKSEAVYDNFRKIYILFMEKDGYTIELVASASEDSVVAGLYKKYRNTPYHFCYTTNRFEYDMNKLAESGFVQMGEPCPAPAINNKNAVFFMSNILGIVELVEE